MALILFFTGIKKAHSNRSSCEASKGNPTIAANLADRPTLKCIGCMRSQIEVNTLRLTFNRQPSEAEMEHIKACLDVALFKGEPA